MDSAHYIGFPKQQKLLLRKIRRGLVARDFKATLLLIEEAKNIYADGEDELLNEVIFLWGETLLIQGYYQDKKDLLHESFQYFSFLNEGNFFNKTALNIIISKYYLYTDDIGTALEHLQIAEKYAQNRSDRIRLTIGYGEYYHHTNAADLCLDYANEAIKLLENTDFFTLRNRAYQLLILVYIDTHQFAKITELAPQLLEWIEGTGDIENEIKTLNAFGISYAVKGDYKNAFEHFSKVKEKSELIGYNQYLATSLINLGNVFSALLNFKEAKKLFKKVVGGLQNFVSPKKIGVCYFNLGGIHLQQREFEEGRFYMQKALDMGTLHNYLPLMSRPLYRIINSYIAEDNYEEALKHTTRAEELTKNMSKVFGEDVNLANLAFINFYQQKHDEALTYALKCIDKCKIVNNNKTLIRTYQLVAGLYKRKGDFEQAYNYMELYVKTHTDYSREQRRRQIIDLEIQYETKEKEKQIEILKSEMQVQDLKLQHQAETEEQNLQLRNVNEDLRQFTYAASHDLKEPIRMIGSFTKILYRQYLDDMNEDQKQYFYYVMNGADRMSKMIQGLLHYATVGTKERDFEWIDLKTILVDVMENLYFAIQDHEAVIEVGDLPKIFSNPVLITQLMQNLISNAIKFKKKNVSPIVKIGWEDREKYDVIYVKDNGIGIPKEHQDVIFKIFKRLHGAKSYEGTGLGLSMVKKIVNQLRGEIWITSEVGEGTTFYISVPKKII